MVRDFMLYDVNINTKVEIDSMTPFPALTICHHHPFSHEGYKLWKEGVVMSPSFFNRKMRNLTLDQLLMNDPEAAEFISYYDGISVYYQNLPYQQVLKIGHKPTIFLTCMYLKDNQIFLGEDCTKLESYKIKLFSHHEHFNCYTFEPTSHSVSTGLSMLGIIASLGPEPKYFDMEQSFIIDTFRQAQGLKVVVHETGTFPDIDESGLHVEPGKMNEISYRPNQWDLINTPKKPCIKDTSKMVYKDLMNTYNYTKHMCLLQADQEEIMKTCHCLFIFNPRPVIPDANMPYCGEILNDFNLTKIGSKIECISLILDQKFRRQQLEKEKCFQRCEFMTFDSTISITKWRATEWHLYWLRQQITSLNLMKQFKVRHPNLNITKSKSFNDWLVYGQKQDLRKTGLKMNELLLKDDNFAYIVLRRESKDSVKKYERLVITQYVLISRIGGLCSLTVGITLAFIVELVEFFYLYMAKVKTDRARKYSTGNRRRSLVSVKGEFDNPLDPWKDRNPKIFANTSSKPEQNNHGNTFVNRHATNLGDDKTNLKEMFL